jgi:type II secretory pathway component PulF
LTAFSATVDWLAWIVLLITCIAVFILWIFYCDVKFRSNIKSW